MGRDGTGRDGTGRDGRTDTHTDIGTDRLFSENIILDLVLRRKHILTYVFVTLFESHDFRCFVPYDLKFDATFLHSKVLSCFDM